MLPFRVPKLLVFTTQAVTHVELGSAFLNETTLESARGDCNLFLVGSLIQRSLEYSN